MHRRESESKIEKANKAKEELAVKYKKLKAFEKALEVSSKAEEDAKEKKDKAESQKERDLKADKETAAKNKVKKVGFAKMREMTTKRKEKEAAAEMAESRVKVKIRKQQNENVKCKKTCIEAGKQMEKSSTPPWLGCYKDVNSTLSSDPPAMSVVISAFDVNSVNWCNDKCLRNSVSNRYFGVRANKCFCSPEGEKFDRYGVAEEDQCILECPGNRDQLCGGPLVNRVFGVQIHEGMYEWNGYTKNDSIPLLSTNMNFERSPCQCTGSLTVQDSPSDFIELEYMYV